MTSKRIVYERPDGKIIIRVPAPNGRRQDESEFSWLERVVTKNPPGRVISICEVQELPQDRKYRNAWRVKNNKIVLDENEKNLIDQKIAKSTLEDRVSALEGIIIGE